MSKKTLNLTADAHLRDFEGSNVMTLPLVDHIKSHRILIKGGEVIDEIGTQQPFPLKTDITIENGRIMKIEKK